MGPQPTNSNQNSRSCGEIISSNCVGWAGGQVPGLNLCQGATLTDVILSMVTNCCNSGANPCAATGWVDISSTVIPSTVDLNSATVTVLAFQNFYGQPSYPTIVNDKPMYRFNKDGDLKMRGVITVQYAATGPIGYAYLDLGTVPPSCLPSNITNAQVVLTEVEARDLQKVPQIMKAYAILLPSGKLRLLLQHDFTYPPITYRWAISLGGVTFNL